MPNLIIVIARFKNLQRGQILFSWGLVPTLGYRSRNFKARETTN